MSESAWELAWKTLREAGERPGDTTELNIEEFDVIGKALSEGEALEKRMAEMERQARRFYRADGTFEELEPDEVIRRRKAAAVRIAELEREVAWTEHRRDRAVEQKEDAEWVAEDARNDRDDARDRLEAAEAQVATLTRERDEAVQGRARESERIIELERDLLSVHDALHAACAPDHPADLPGEIRALRAERDRLRGALESLLEWATGRDVHGRNEAPDQCGYCVALARARAALAPQAESREHVWQENRNEAGQIYRQCTRCGGYESECSKTPCVP